jgi:hypothetical protein
MVTKNEQLQSLWRKYQEEHDRLPASTREVIKWAVDSGRLGMPEIDPYDALAGDLAKALREEYDTDSKGRRYRKNHALRVTKGGVQHTFWGVMGFAPKEHMQGAFRQRREQIVGDCCQLKTDIDVYNDTSKNEEPIALVLDFTDDVAEREFSDDKKGP